MNALTTIVQILLFTLFIFIVFRIQYYLSGNIIKTRWGEFIYTCKRRNKTMYVHSSFRQFISELGDINEELHSKKLIKKINPLEKQW
jgi:hypothetical protein